MTLTLTIVQLELLEEFWSRLALGELFTVAAEA